jgi:hypothetical protein
MHDCKFEPFILFYLTRSCDNDLLCSDQLRAPSNVGQHAGSRVCGSCTDGTMGHELLSADSIGPVEPNRICARCLQAPCMCTWSRSVPVQRTYERVSDQSSQIGPVRKSPAKDKPQIWHHTYNAQSYQKKNLNNKIKSHNIIYSLRSEI